MTSGTISLGLLVIAVLFIGGIIYSRWQKQNKNRPQRINGIQQQHNQPMAQQTQPSLSQQLWNQSQTAHPSNVPDVPTMTLQMVVKIYEKVLELLGEDDEEVEDGDGVEPPEETFPHACPYYVEAMKRERDNNDEAQTTPVPPKRDKKTKRVKRGK